MIKKFICTGCNAQCITEVTEQPESSKKRLPTDCVFGIFSFSNDDDICKWHKFDSLKNTTKTLKKYQKSCKK